MVSERELLILFPDSQRRGIDCVPLISRNRPLMVGCRAMPVGMRRFDPPFRSKQKPPLESRFLRRCRHADLPAPPGRRVLPRGSFAAQAGHVPPRHWKEAFRRSWKAARRRGRTPGVRGRTTIRDGGASLVRNRVLDASHERHNAQKDDSTARLISRSLRHFAKPGVWEALPGGQKLALSSLRDMGLKLGIISNFDRRLYRVLDHQGLAPYFSSVTISSEVGADKPDGGHLPPRFGQDHWMWHAGAGGACRR